ncbi:efflux RND transporter permease subunit [Billgrantia endophytica]|uniref:AcrB/AcrD/AcrF family protein n=1 Tax=Billgrantia endophytica TaxID=2033802 RepID=A0A2N7U4X0_9GAMM|nr:efflux RND transporter permease subunit [Halomonas endophytica]PMR75464.1 AcrB/AcrD/AcrF family protein [Halomonas endophytica]
MNWVLSTLQHRRLVLTVTALLASLGLAAWLAMDRQEDPFFPYRFGQVMVPYPGAEPEQVERLVLNPLEEELAQVEEVNEIIGTARLGLAHVQIEMHEHVYDTVPLGELADIHIMAREPAVERLWHDGKPAVALGIILSQDRVNAVRFGETLRTLLDDLRPGYAPLEIEEMFYQPRWVEQRLAELGFSLLLGITILGVLLFLAMGLRLGLSVMLIVPLVTFSSLAIYAMGGGVLHQIAVAGMVIALGMLVDNAIVMVENIQWHRDQGASASEAATRSVSELAKPLLAATGTTLAAFVPLLLSSGNTADFTRAIPVMVMLTLVISYLYAVFVTPVFAAGLLKPRGTPGRRGLQHMGTCIARCAVRWPAWILVGAVGLLAGALAMLPLLNHDFFPDTDRNQLVVDLHFAEGTHLDYTAHHAGVLASDFRTRPGVLRVHRFVGSSGPRFYYNLAEQPRQPHLARLVVEAESADDLAGLMEWARAVAPEQLPEADVVARRLGQGPPVNAPIEIRVFGEDRARLAEAASRILSVVRTAEGSRDARHLLGEGLATLRVTVDDARAAQFGLARQDVAMAVAGASRGVEVSTWRAGRDPAPLLVRSPEGERFPAAGLEGLRLATDNGESVPLGEVAALHTVWQPAVIQHRSLQRMTAVLAEVGEGYTYAGVLDVILPRLAELELPEGVSYTVGGAAESADDANTALFRTLPFGALLLVVFLLAQFNSFRQLGIVLTTVPLAAIGVIPGLWLTGQPFGFTAMLGVVALVGIVVNNAIVLIDVMNANRRQGMELNEAVVGAVARRTRPVLLTTATTVAGMIPLTLTQSTLWPPMAWAIISGLMVSTLLTLFVIPALYRLVMKPQRSWMVSMG